MTEQRMEGAGAPTAPEDVVQIERFSAEAKEALQKKGYLIYKVTGKTFEELQRELPDDIKLTTDFWREQPISYQEQPQETFRITHPNRTVSPVHAKLGEPQPEHTGKTGMEEQMDRLERMRSRATEVAVRAGYVFISNRNSMPDQNVPGMIKEFSEELSAQVPDVRAIQGDTLDYVELGIQYAKEIDGSSLYGGWTNRRQAAATSGLNVSSIPKEGNNKAEIIVRSLRGGNLNNEGPWAVPLIVPQAVK